MEMLNRAIEDASEASQFFRKITGEHPPTRRLFPVDDRRDGENRKQRRARIRAERRAAKRSTRTPA